MSLPKINSKLLFFFFLFTFLSLTSFSDSGADFQIKSSLDKKITGLQQSIPVQSGRMLKKSVRKLFNLHKKRVKMDLYDQQAIWKFIRDDLKYGNGGYAVHLLERTKNNENVLKLMELNCDPERQNKKVRMKTFTLNPFRSFWNFISGKDIYEFKKGNAQSLKIYIEESKFNQGQKVFYDRLNLIFEGKAGFEVLKSPSKPILPPKPIKTVEKAVIVKPVYEIQQSTEKSQNDEVRVASKLSEAELIKKDLEEKSGEQKNEKKEAEQKTIPTPVSAQIITNVIPPVVPESLTSSIPEAKVPVPETKKMVTVSEYKNKEQEKQKSLVAKKEENPRYYWEVVKVIQEVKRKRGDDGFWEDAKAGDKLFEGDTFKTGEQSSVLLLIRGLDNKDSYTQLFENTELKVIQLSMNNLNELDDAYLDVIMGEVLVNVEDLPQKSSFKVKTPSAVAAIRGTKFSTKVLSETVSKFLLFKGRLEVSQQTVAGNMMQFMNEGEELVNDFNVPLNEPSILDEATIAEYEQKAAEIAEAILEKMEAGGFSEEESDLEEGEEEYVLEEGKENEDEEPVDDPGGPDDGTDKNGEDIPDNILVNPETGQLLNPDGTPILDSNGNPVYYGENGPVDINGNPVFFSPNPGEEGYIPPPVDSEGNVIGPDGQVLLDEFGNPVKLNAEGIPVDSQGNPIDFGPNPGEEGYMPPPVNEEGYVLGPDGQVILDEFGNPFKLNSEGIPVDSQGNPIDFGPKPGEEGYMPPSDFQDPNFFNDIEPMNTFYPLAGSGTPEEYQPVEILGYHWMVFIKTNRLFWMDGNPVINPKTGKQLLMNWSKNLPMDESGKIIDPNTIFPPPDGLDFSDSDAPLVSDEFGTFAIPTDAEGYLIDPNGNYILDANGSRIKLLSDGTFVDESGNPTAVPLPNQTEFYDPFLDPANFDSQGNYIGPWEYDPSNPQSPFYDPNSQFYNPTKDPSAIGLPVAVIEKISGPDDDGQGNLKVTFSAANSFVSGKVGQPGNGIVAYEWVNDTINGLGSLSSNSDVETTLTIPNTLEKEDVNLILKVWDAKGNMAETDLNDFGNFGEAPEYDIFINEQSGSDSYEGTFDRPYKTITKALSAVNNIPDGKVIGIFFQHNNISGGYTYNLSDTILISPSNVGERQIHLVGDLSKSSNNRTTLRGINGAPVIEFLNSTNCRVDCLRIDGSAGSTRGLSFDGCSQVQIVGTAVENCDTGLYMSDSGGRADSGTTFNGNGVGANLQSSWAAFIGCEFATNDQAVIVNGTAPSTVPGESDIHVLFGECSISGNDSTNPVIDIQSTSSGVFFEQTIIRNNFAQTGGELIRSNASFLEFENVLFLENDAQGSPGDYCLVRHTASGNRCSFLYCTFANNTSNGNGKIVLEGGPIDIVSSSFTGFSHTTPVIAAGDLNASDFGTIENNFFASSTPDISDMIVDIGGSQYNLAGSAGDLNNDLTNANDNIGGVNPNYENKTINFGYSVLNGTYNNCFPSSTSLLVGNASTTYDTVSEALNGTRDGSPDIGCFERGGGDPIVTGRIYDSVTGETINNAVVAIYQKGITSALTTEKVESGTYSFNVLPGKYYIAVSKSGYLFPSNRKDKATTGDHGDTFEVIEYVNQTIDIPMDSTPYLTVKKTSNKNQASPGEIITYNISIKNNYTFSSVKNFNIIDKLPSGFKFISGSILKDGEQFANPRRDGDILTFPIQAIGRLSTINISYQVSVSTGLESGKYSSEVFANSQATEEVMSNISKHYVHIFPDPLFNNGTLIGRVFIDQNNNNEFDIGEKGVKGAKVVTEMGVVVETDEFGIYHLKNVFTGRHLLKVDPESLPLGYKTDQDHGYPFEIFQGSVAKVNVPVIQQSDSVSKLTDKFLIVALGEISLTHNSIDGNLEMLEKNDEFDEGFNVNGRGAFYIRGKIKGKYLIEASFDSYRNSREYEYFRYNKIFTNLDPDKYYPVYGDGSKVSYRASETKDAFFILIRWDDSFARWGSMEVNWPVYRRVMHGANVVYKSVEKTEFGESKLETELFYAVSDNQSVQEQFIGTGTSVYHLQNNPVIEGSERVKVEVKNRFSNTAITSRVLVEEIDYEIDYEKGIIVLTRPLTSTVINYDQSIISNDILAGAQAVLVVDYEYEKRSILDRASFGGKIKKTFFDHLSIEAGYAEEERNNDPYRLFTSTATYIVNPKTSVSVSFNESEETFAGGGLSYDGGMTMASQPSNFKEGQSGSSLSLSGNSVLLEDKLALSASFTDTEAGHSALGSTGTSDTKSYSFDTSYRLNDALSMGLFHQSNETSSADPLTQAVAVVDELDKTNVYLEFNRERWDSRLEYTYQNIGQAFSGVRYLGALPPRGKQLLALRLGWRPYERQRYYIIGQTTIKKEELENLDNDMFTLGMQFPLFEKVDIMLEARTGNIGDSALCSLILNDEGKEQSHIGFETGTQTDGERFKSLSFSKRYLSDSGMNFRFIKDYSYYNKRILNGDIFDMEIPFNNRWTLGIGYETSEIDEDEAPNAFSRDVATFRYNYLVPGVSKFFGKVEWRKDLNHSEDTETKHVYLEDELSCYLFEGLSVRIKGALGYAEEDESNEEKFEFKQASIGFAWRPQQSDWINIIGKHIYTYDLPLDNLNSFREFTEQRKRVTSFDSVIDINRFFQLVEKLAYREMTEKVGNREWQDSDTWLWVTGLNLLFLENWSLGAEYRILENKTFEDRKTGYLLQVKRLMNEWITMVLGYNFTKFDDDLSNRDEYDRSGLFVRLEGRY